MKKYCLSFLFIILATACTPKESPKPVVREVKYPYVSWRRTMNGRTIVMEDSQRRLFAVELNDANRPVALHALEKSSGRQRWTWDGELGLLDPDLPWTANLFVRGNTLAFWTADNRIIGLDRYSGADKWEKPVKGIGLAALGENFITVWNDEIRLVENETGKITALKLGKRITAPLAITPKGYVVVTTGDTAHLVDLENEKLTVKWSWKPDLAGGFRISQVHAAEDAIVFFQKTAAEDNHLRIVGYDLQELKEVSRLDIRGSEENPRAFTHYSDNDNVVRLLVRPEHSGDLELHSVDLSESKHLGVNYLAGKLDAPCWLGVSQSYCGTDSGFDAYTTHPWKKIWSEETIYPGSEGRHLIIGGNLVTAGGSRVKVFTPTRTSPLTYDLKSPSLKEPRVNRILGAEGDVLWFTVVDYSTDRVRRKPVGEIWAFSTASGQVIHRIPVGDPQSTVDTVRFLPKEGLILAADDRSFMTIALAGGRVQRRGHKVKLSGKESLAIHLQQNLAVVAGSQGVHVFEFARMRDLGYRDLSVPAAEASVRASFLASSDSHLFVRTQEGDKQIVALELKTGKQVWAVPSPEILDPRVALVPAGLLLASPENTRLLNPADGKTVRELPGSLRLVQLADRVILFHREKTTPAPAGRLQVVSYEAEEDLPRMLWERKFEAGEEAPLPGFPVAWPLWVAAENDFVLLPSGGGRCLEILGSADGSPVLNLCKGAWPWPPILYERFFYHATGMYMDAIPEEQQGLLQFSLSGQYKQIMKLGKGQGDTFMIPQFSVMQRRTIYLLMTQNALSAVQVGNPDQD